MPKSRRRRSRITRANGGRSTTTTSRDPDLTADILRATLYSSLARAQYCLTLSQHCDRISHRAGFTGAIVAMSHPLEAILGLQTMIPAWERQGPDVTPAARRRIAQRLIKPLEAFLDRANQPRPVDPEQQIPSMADILVSLHIATIISAASALKAGMVLSAKTANLHIGEPLRRHYQGAARLYSNGDTEDEFAPNLPDALEYFDHNIDDMNPNFANLIRPALQLAQQVGRPNHSHSA